MIYSHNSSQKQSILKHQQKNGISMSTQALDIVHPLTKLFERINEIRSLKPRRTCSVTSSYTEPRV
jgi:hypothetical protein